MKKAIQALSDYTWTKTGERCCMTHRLVPRENPASPCHAVVYQLCPTTHRESRPQCPIPLSFRWIAFAATAMTAKQIGAGSGTSVSGCKTQAVVAITENNYIEREIAATV